MGRKCNYQILLKSEVLCLLM